MSSSVKDLLQTSVILPVIDNNSFVGIWNKIEFKIDT